MRANFHLGCKWDIFGPSFSNDRKGVGGGGVCLRSWCARRCSGVLKKSERRGSQTAGEQGDKWEGEREGGAGHLSLERSASSIEWREETGDGGEGGGAGAWVTDRSSQRELGSQHAAGMAGRQAAVIQIISSTAACSSAHRLILIGKISWDKLQKSCTLSDGTVSSQTLGKLRGGGHECYSMSQLCTEGSWDIWVK